MRESRVLGAMLGLAAGDRIGGPTRMALQLSQSLLHSQGFAVEEVAARYLAWWQTEGFDTGPTAARVFLGVEQGQSWEAAAARVNQQAGGLTAGCNPAHRSAPLALCAFIPDHQLAEYAHVEARLTHLHPLAGDVSAAVVCLCRALLRGDSWECARQSAALGRLPETQEALELSEAKRLSAGGFAPEVLRAALAFIETSPSLSEALERAIAFADPANYCPVLVGSLGGARWGAEAIPEALLTSHAVLRPMLEQTAQSLAADWEERAS
ncbi:ADP-ribosylglycohydrolase family protein [Armatimonas sp.]|uniref:ADP-ribosylglycohydrolase family protein n=1 Tax=Armatimonas sp. TaxID=1872638 RepID=UPI00374D173E